MTTRTRTLDLIQRALRDPRTAYATLRPVLQREGTLRSYRKVGEVVPPRAWRAGQSLLLALGTVLGLTPPLRSVGRVLQVTALWELGRRDEALRLVASLGDRVSPRATAVIAELLTEGASQVAAGLAARLDPAQPRAALLQARLLETHGHLRAALRRVEDGLSATPRHVALRLAQERLAGELSVLDDPVGPRAGTRLRPWQPVLGRQLHLLVSSLPYRQSGYSVRSHATARALLAEGLRPWLVTRPGFPLNEGVLGAPEQEIVEGVPYRRLAPDRAMRLPLDQYLEASVQLTAPIVQELRPAVLQPTSDFPNALTALRLRDALGLPVVYEVRGFLEETWLTRAGRDAMSSDRYQLHRALETRCMQEADAVVTLAEVMKRQMVERGVPADKIVVVPNAVQVDQFHPLPPPTGLRARWGIGPGEVVLGYVTSVTAYEGLGSLLRAVAILRGRGRPVAALIVGEGSERATLERLAAELRISEHVVFTGRVPHADVNAYYNAIDVFVVPRRDDPVCHLVAPLKPFEAMAAARPVVVSRLAPLLEVIDEGRVGLSFRPGDAADLANVLEPLVEDPARRQELGERARTWVTEQRTWARNARLYREVYERLGAV